MTEPISSGAVRSKRFDYLDNLKVFLTVLVIFHHAGQAYGDGGDWAYHPSNPEEVAGWLWRFFGVNAAYFMGLFFLISGYFIPKSYARQGFWKFLGKKFSRLGIPLLLIGATLSLLLHKLELAHMWYVEHLLFYSVVYAVLMLGITWVQRLCRRDSHPGAPASKAPALATGTASDTASRLSFLPALLFLLATTAGLAAVNYVVRPIYPQDKWIALFGFLVCEPAHLTQYVLLFVMGILASRRNWLDRMPKSMGIVAFVLAIGLACCLWLAPDNSPLINLVTSKWYAWEAAVAVFMSTGLLWLFRDVLNKSDKFLKWCADQSYGAYVLHLLLMLGFQFLTDSIWLGGGTEKFLFIGVCTTFLSFGLAWLLRLILIPLRRKF